MRCRVQINNGFNFSDFSGLTAAQKASEEITLTTNSPLVLYRFEKPAGCRVSFTCDVFVEEVTTNPTVDVRLVIRQRAPGNLGVNTTYPGFTNKKGEWVTITTEADFTDPRLLSNPEDANGHCRIEVGGNAVARFRRPQIVITPIIGMTGMNPFFYSVGGTEEGFIRLGGSFGLGWKRVNVDLTQEESRFDLPDGADRLLGNEAMSGWCLSSSQTDGGEFVSDMPRLATRMRTITYDESDPGTTRNTLSVFSDGNTNITSANLLVWFAGRTKIVDKDWDV